ncbi:DNRLRE domain-containing protein, partial [Paenibacillus sp. MCAF20]
VVEHNVVKNFANTNVGNRNYAGIWVFAADNTIFQYNEVFGGKYGYNDGEAYDIDLYCNNTLFQYNYSHNNRGGFSLFMNGSTNSVFRYNVSVNDGSDAEIFYYGPSTAAEAPEIYNNTIITGQNSNTKIFNAWNANATMKFYNNIIYGGKNVKFSNFAAKGSFANNSVYPPHILDTNGPTTHPGLVTANPKISNPWVEVLGIENTNVYKLSSDSPLINAGKVISNNGGKDYFGNVLTDGLPDIGAHEYTNDPGPKPEPIPVTSVILNKTELTLIKGDSHTLNASVLPTTVYDKEVTWKSSDPSIIQVSQSGQVKALAPGHAVITATSNQDEAISTQCEITVTDTPEGLLFATEDAFVRDGSSANSNFGKEALLYIKNDAAGYARKAYMKFDLGSLSPKEIKSAKLRLYVDVADGNPNRTISLYKTSNSWSESAITWNNAPQAEGLLGTFPVANESLKNWITVDVTDFIHASKNEGLVSLLLKNEAAYSPTSGIANIQFGSRENDNRPQLFIEYEDETLPGANLLINGGFESSSLSPAPWTYYNGVQIMSDQNVRTGNNALKFSNAISGLEQVVQGLTPNTNYVLKGWMKSTDVSNTQSLGVKNYGGVQVSKSVGSLEYSEAKLIFKTGATNTKATIYSYKGSNTGKLAYVDDITLEQYEKPAAENVTFTTKQNQAYVGNLNVTHADGETLTYTLLTAGEKGSVVINASTGSFTYTPDLGVIGTDVFTVKVNDGIADSEPITVTVDIVDGLPPVTTDNAASGWQQNVQTVYLDAKDNSAGAVQTFYSIDGAPFIEGNTIVIEQEGEHEIHYYSIDAAGNQEEVKSSIIKIDRTGPEIIPTAPLNVYQSDAVAISFQTTDQWSGVVEVAVTLDGEVMSNQTTLEPLALTLGEHIIQVTAGDEAGSETVREFTLNIIIDADRLDDVLMIGYNKGWITNAGILQSLLAKVEQIQENSENASNEFIALENHLRAQSGKHIEESFTQLLLDDIAFIKSMNR